MIQDAEAAGALPPPLDPSTEWSPMSIPDNHAQGIKAPNEAKEEDVASKLNDIDNSISLAISRSHTGGKNVQRFSLHTD